MGLSALLHVLRAASLLESLPRHVLLDILTHLLGDLVALPAGDGGALALRDLLGLDPGHQGANTPGLLLAVPDWDLLAGLAAELLAVDLGHLDTPHLGDIGALLSGEATALTVSSLLAVSPW